MINSKQRAYLKSLAHDLKPLIQVGKSGITEGLLSQIDASLESHEHIKITFLQNSPVEGKEVVDEIIEATGADFVNLIGKKLTLYRESKENKKIEL